MFKTTHRTVQTPPAESNKCCLIWPLYQLLILLATPKYILKAAGKLHCYHTVDVNQLWPQLCFVNQLSFPPEVLLEQPYNEAPTKAPY